MLSVDIHKYLPILIQDYDTLEKARVATSNRRRGVSKGGRGRDPVDISVWQLKSLQSNIKKIIQQMSSETPTLRWLDSLRGVNFLLASKVYYHVVIRGMNGTNHGFRSLLEYCGLTPRSSPYLKKKGQKLSYSMECKKTLWLLTECLIRQRNPEFYPLYLAFKEAERQKLFGEKEVHHSNCPLFQAGKCQATNSQLAKGEKNPHPGCLAHIHSRAKRKVAREILKRIWRMERSNAGLKHGDLQGGNLDG